METKESITTPAVFHVKGSELPPTLAQRAGVSPDQSVWITVSTEDPSPKVRMRKILQRSRAHAQKAGLTEEKLAELLKDD